MLSSLTIIIFATLDRSRSGWFITFAEEFKDVEEEVEEAIVDTRFCTPDLTKKDDCNDHPYTPKIIIVLHALIHSLHIIKMILRF